ASSFRSCLASCRSTPSPYNGNLIEDLEMVTTRPGRSAGFTLVELLVVLAILTLLAGIVGPRVLAQLGGAKSKTAAVQIADIDKALELFKLDVGRFPTTEEGLEA